MDAKLRCSISPGQFSDEFAISAGEFSLFASKVDVEVERAPSGEQATDGWLWVEVVEKGDKASLVRLPNEAFEIGYLVRVANDRLQSGRRKQVIKP